MKDLRKLALNGLIYEQAVENIGIYPMSVKDGEHGYKKRTEKMEGHNECVMQITSNVVKIEEYIKNNKFKDDIETALLEDYASINVCDDDKIGLYVNCNDLFYWACADSEEIEPNELQDLFKCYEKSKSFGGFLWACKKTGMRPQTPWYESFSEEEKRLFDECGPFRDPAECG